MLRKALGRIRRLHKMWLLLLIPMGLLSAIIALPILLLAMMMGSRLLSIFIGPINIWNTPGHAPPPQDVAGIYTPDDQSRADLARDHVALSAFSYIKLNLDNTLEIHDIPSFDGFGQAQQCASDGVGKWRFYETNSEVQLELHITAADPSNGKPLCASSNEPFMELLGRHAPYRLYQIIGDPDSDTGITYLRR